MGVNRKLHTSTKTKSRGCQWGGESQLEVLDVNLQLLMSIGGIQRELQIKTSIGGGERQSEVANIRLRNKDCLDLKKKLSIYV